MLPSDWTPHRRDDGELIGWIRPAGEEWIGVDLLGREASGPVDWLEAEAALEEVGLAWLADVWMLEGEADEPLRVRFVEVTPADQSGDGRVVVKVDDFGDMQRPPTERFILEWAAPSAEPAG